MLLSSVGQSRRDQRPTQSQFNILKIDAKLSLETRLVNVFHVLEVDMVHALSVPRTSAWLSLSKVDFISYSHLPYTNLCHAFARLNCGCRYSRVSMILSVIKYV